MTEELKELLYGKTIKARLADGAEYTLREPSIDSLESSDLNLSKMDDLGSIKKLAWLMLKDDNKSLTEKSVGKLITFSMLKDGSEFLKSVFGLLNSSGETKNVVGAGI